MYLSRLILNQRSRRVQRELAEPYEMHRSIMRAFPAELPEKVERVLWRVDEHPRWGTVLLVQSRGVPDWSWLAEDGTRGYLLAVDEPNPAVKKFEFQPTAAQHFSFRLRANPTKRLGKSAEYGKGKRVGIYKEDEQLAWLARKGEQHGFRVLHAQISRDGKIKDEKKVQQPGADSCAPDAADKNEVDAPKGVYKLDLLSVQFDGTLQVIDPDKLIAAVETGIGSGKGFGFGLLSLAPVQG